MKEEKYKHGTQTELGVEGEEFNKYYSTTSHSRLRYHNTRPSDARCLSDSTSILKGLFSFTFLPLNC